MNELSTKKDEEVHKMAEQRDQAKKELETFKAEF